jgi:hypothetical protein
VTDTTRSTRASCFELFKVIGCEGELGGWLLTGAGDADQSPAADEEETVGWVAGNVHNDPDSAELGSRAAGVLLAVRRLWP